MKGHRDKLMAPDRKMMMKRSEVELMMGIHDKEIAQKNMYIRKYFHPYLCYKVKKFEYLREKLLVFGSLESLVTLYMRLVRGVAYPPEEVKAIREFESKIIDHANFLITGAFEEVGRVRERIVEEMAEYHESVDSFKAASL